MQVRVCFGKGERVKVRVEQDQCCTILGFLFGRIIKNWIPAHIFIFCGNSNFGGKNEGNKGKKKMVGTQILGQR